MEFLMISKSYSNFLMEEYLCVFFTSLFLLLLLASAVFPTKAALYLNDLELPILKSELLAGASSLLNWYKLSDVSE